MDKFQAELYYSMYQSAATPAAKRNIASAIIKSVNYFSATAIASRQVNTDREAAKLLIRLNAPVSDYIAVSIERYKE